MYQFCPYPVRTREATEEEVARIETAAQREREEERKRSEKAAEEQRLLEQARHLDPAERRAKIAELDAQQRDLLDEYIRGGELTREAFRERLDKLKSATKALLRAGAEEKQ